MTKMMILFVTIALNELSETNSEKAFDRLAQGVIASPDYILLDLNMPK